LLVLFVRSAHAQIGRPAAAGVVVPVMMRAKHAL
jgi:hypothetical protein